MPSIVKCWQGALVWLLWSLLALVFGPEQLAWLLLKTVNPMLTTPHARLRCDTKLELVMDANIFSSPDNAWDKRQQFCHHFLITQTAGIPP